MNWIELRTFKLKAFDDFIAWLAYKQKWESHETLESSSYMERNHYSNGSTLWFKTWGKCLPEKNDRANSIYHCLPEYFQDRRIKFSYIFLKGHYHIKVFKNIGNNLNEDWRQVRNLNLPFIRNIFDAMDMAFKVGFDLINKNTHQ